MKKSFLFISLLIVMSSMTTQAQYTMIQQGNKLVGTGAASTSQQGWSVSLSADGNTAIVGGPDDSSATGAAWVFTRSITGVWIQQGDKLVGSGSDGTARQGSSVSISGDGNTVIVGGPDDNGYNDGAVWVWTRTAGTWTQQGNKLVGTGAYGSNQGNSVSISDDGNTVIVGGSRDNGDKGAIWFFTRSAGVWTQQGSKITHPNSFGLGRSVSLSGDGNTAIVGGSDNDAFSSTDGGAWIYNRSAGVWTREPNQLIGSSSALFTGSNQGNVSISADGNTALVGGDGDSLGTGAVWVWTRTAGVWTQQGNKLVGTGVVGRGRQGSSVSISGDGNTAIFGGYEDNNFAGAAWVFTRSAGVWTQQGSKITGLGAVGNANQGNSVSLSTDGNTALLGGLNDGSTGAVWVFAQTQLPCFSYYNTTYDTLHNTFILIVDSTTTALANSYYWDFGDGDTSTFATPTHVYFVDTVYDVCLKITTIIGDTCSYCHEIGKDYLGNIYRTNGFTLNIGNQDLQTGIAPLISNSSNIVIYPNPTNSIFSISGDDIKGFNSVELTDIVGKVLLRTNTLTNIDLSNLQSGVYIYKVIGDNTFTGKVIKE